MTSSYFNPSAPVPALLTTISQDGVIASGTILETLDFSQYRSASIQCVSMGTGGVVTPEWSNNGVNWQIATLGAPGGLSVATAISQAGLWVVPKMARYLQFRQSTATTSGATTFSINQFDDSQPMWGGLPAGTAAIGDVGFQYRANAIGAGTPGAVSSAATPTAVTLKSAAGRVVGYELFNSAASPRFLKGFNTASPTLGTTAAGYDLVIPAGGVISQSFPGGISHSAAIVYAVTSARGLTDNTATGLAAGDVTGIILYS